MSSETWMRKTVVKTINGSTLQIILCSIMINNSVGIKAEYIEEVHSTYTNTIPRTYSKLIKPFYFEQLFQEFLQINLRQYYILFKN